LKLKAAKKDFKNKNVLKVGYCELDYLLSYVEPFAYSSGVYGWSCDYYNIDGVIISTGYSPIGKSLDYDIIKKYENEARKILLDNNSSYDNKKEKVNNLLNELVQEFKSTL
jgi:hypothetical protein